MRSGPGRSPLQRFAERVSGRWVPGEALARSVHGKRSLANQELTSGVLGRLARAAHQPRRVPEAQGAGICGARRFWTRFGTRTWRRVSEGLVQRVNFAGRSGVRCGRLPSEERKSANPLQQYSLRGDERIWTLVFGTRGDISCGGGRALYCSRWYNDVSSYRNDSS